MCDVRGGKAALYLKKGLIRKGLYAAMIVIHLLFVDTKYTVIQLTWDK
jgi:hypothetical protein